MTAAVTLLDAVLVAVDVAVLVTVTDGLAVLDAVLLGVCVGLAVKETVVDGVPL